MKADYVKKYRPYRPLEYKERTWPDNHITRAPRWCTVDLRDGNQALIYPMNIDEKVKMFNLLVEIGFKEIEVGFPAAADVEFRFLRTLVERNLIPDDVTVQVLTQAREHLIRKTFEALHGVKNAVVHLYNSTSTLQREVVFRKNRDEIKELAVEGVRLVKHLIDEADTNVQLQYSPESFTGTEVDYAVEVCSAVMDVWQPTEENRIILNLPATVEMTTPNIYADQVEYFINKLPDREKAVISLHTHNDRGTGVAATEMGLMAGADRVEGTLFGNGERTGNVDLVTLALNMYSQGVDPELDLHDVNHIMEVYEETTRMSIHPRHPYVGELVYTAFSGSHQDAIHKGMAAYREGERSHWEVPYLPMDPRDIGRTYDSIIRINSQSGKGGVAYVMEHDFGYRLPKTMHPEFAVVIQQLAEEQGGEIKPGDIWHAFEEAYINNEGPFKLVSFQSRPAEDNPEMVESELRLDVEGGEVIIAGRGNGPIDSCKNAFYESGLARVRLTHYSQHSLGEGSDSKAAAYIQIVTEKDEKLFGVGVHVNTQRASLMAFISALNRAALKGLIVIDRVAAGQSV